MKSVVILMFSRSKCHPKLCCLFTNKENKRLCKKNLATIKAEKENTYIYKQEFMSGVQWDVIVLP